MRETGLYKNSYGHSWEPGSSESHPAIGDPSYQSVYGSGHRLYGRTLKRFEDDKILTKTMINNYAKNKLLPPPEKKRYSKEHMYMLIFIYYLKGFLPLTDIQAILKPISDEFFGSDSDFCMEDIYKEVFRLGEENISDIGHDILENFHTAANSFKDYDGEDRDTLQLFAFICLLSFDIYLKKEVIEQLIDAMEKKKNS